jgi:hypothetical protein
MASNINTAIPPFGNATTAGVRTNFTSAKTEIEALQTKLGFVNYNDALTAVTPITMPAATWVKLTNNKLGPSTVTSVLPGGITNLWSTVNNQLIFTEVPLLSVLELRIDVEITTVGTNREVKLAIDFAIGSAGAFTLPVFEMVYRNAGAHQIVVNIPFYIGSANTRDFPAEIKAINEVAGTAKVNGWFIQVTKNLVA